MEGVMEGAESNVSLWRVGVYVSEMSVVHEESGKYKSQSGIHEEVER
jgi:hypothetical protein